MGNDPRDQDGMRLQNALFLLGRHKSIRMQLIDFLRNAENSIQCKGAVRDEITGPIIDALHDPHDIYEKTLLDGTKFKFLYRTKIARDFMMATEEHPTHVWEPQTTKLLLNLTTNLVGDVIVGGAYFGDQAVLVAKNLKHCKRDIHCFEPNPEQNKMLKENFSINKLENVRFNSKGLWSESSIHMKLDGFDSFANAIPANVTDEGFETITIDDYQEQHNIHIGLIQLDIEGAELQTLQGAQKSLARFQPHIIVEVHRDYVDWSKGLEKTKLCEMLFNNGYTIFAIRDFNTHYEMHDKPIELIPVTKVYLEGPPHGFNMVAVQDPSIFNNSKYRIVTNVSPKLLVHKNSELHHPLDGL